MKLRLAHLLFVVVFAQTALATLGMGTLMAWNLRHGFATYIEANDRRRLQTAAQIATNVIGESDIAENEGFDALRERGDIMHQIMDAEAAHEGIPAGERVGPSPGADTQAQPDRPSDRLPARGGGQEFGGRVALYDLNGDEILGPPLPVHGAYIAEPVRLKGHVAGYLRAYRAPVPRDLERGFLKGQYFNLAGLSAGLLILSMGVSWLCARWLARPLETMGRASQAYAAGDFDHAIGRSFVSELDQTGQSLSGMATALHALDATRRRWLAQMSHELRTPVTVLRGELELLSDGIRKPTSAAIRSLLDETLRLGRLIEDLHLLAVSDAGRLPMHFAATDAMAVARRAVGRFRRQIEEKGLIFVWNDGPEKLTGNWDEARLDQILANLLGNAVAYTDAPGFVRLNVRATQDTVIFLIEDSAPGLGTIDEVAGTPAHYSGGAGLGLKICHNLAKAHGGQLVLSTSPLGGLRAELILPTSAMEAV